MSINIYSIAVLLFCANIFSGNAQDIPPTTSLIYPGVDGKLVYVADSLGNKIPDFSNAGYKGGGVIIPYVPIKKPRCGLCPAIIPPLFKKLLTASLYFHRIAMGSAARYCLKWVCMN